MPWQQSSSARAPLRSTRSFARVLGILVFITLTAAAQAPPAPATLPEGFIRQAYYFQLEPPPKGTPPWAWRLVRGSLPPGIALDPSGILSGAATAPGQFRFTLQAADSASRSIVKARDYVLNVAPPLTIVWTQPPHVTSEGGISGELQVTNGSGETADLTVIVVAVNTVNKAFALGYQRFSFGVGKQRIPFGSTLPRDIYVVHADAVGEIAASNEIYRSRLQTAPLTVP